MQPQLIIQITPDGQVQVGGPLENKLLCYGMLEMARDAIRDYKAPVGIVLAPAGMAEQLKK